MGSIHGVEGCSFGRIAGAACPEARPVDDIDDADDADEPRTKARRRRVRLKRRSPRGAPKAKGVPCDFRRGCVDVVDFGGIVEGHLRGGPPPERGRETWRIGNWNWRLATLAHWQHSTHVANVKRLPVPMLPVFSQKALPSRFVRGPGKARSRSAKEGRACACTLPAGRLDLVNFPGFGRSTVCSGANLLARSLADPRLEFNSVSRFLVGVVSKGFSYLTCARPRNLTRGREAKISLAFCPEDD